MGLIERIFGNGEAAASVPATKFGRYTDSYKTHDQYNAWDRSLELFEKGEYLNSYRAFFEYLRDEEEENLSFVEKNGQIEFEILQGSKKVHGFATAQKVYAEAKVVLTTELDIGFLRRLIEQNFDLKYSRFALDDQNDITIIFDTFSLDGSPYKLYYALKEMATNADKQDDLLIDEFPMLQSTDTSHLTDLPETEKEVKFQFIREEIQKVIDEANSGKLDPIQYPGGIAYLFLYLCYKLDYLTKPEGYLMEALERIHRQYFANDKQTNHQKNHVLQKEFQKLLERPKDQYFKEMYQVKATFGITSPVNHDKVVSFIDGELPNMDWYKEQGHELVAFSIPGYIVGYCLFNYAVPKPDRDFMLLYFQIAEAHYFKRLGYPLNYYDPTTRKFNKKAIRKAIRKIAEENAANYPSINPVFGQLDFTDLLSFAKSYLLMIRNTDVTKVD